MNTPTKDQIRDARRQGAANALSHLQEAQRKDMLTVHAKLDDRRTKNKEEFRAKVISGTSVK